jgi:GR25 family glycosyltransferase involved in LPS biosynthesis
MNLLSEAWIIHKLGNPDRLYSLTSQLSSYLNLDKLNVVTTEDGFDLRIKYPQELSEDLSHLQYSIRPLRTAEISVFKKHYLALREISHYQKKAGFIFEDDVVFVSIERFNLLWHRVYCTSCFDRYDIVFFGDGSHVKSNKLGIIEPTHTWHKTKCADSYFIKPKAASLIISDYNHLPPFMPYDWDLSLRINRLNLQVAWVQPALTYQGSQSGVFQSLIQ